MTGRNQPPPKSQAQLEREKRLAEALRANLRRRKAADQTGMAARQDKPARPRQVQAGEETGE